MNPKIYQSNMAAMRAIFEPMADAIEGAASYSAHRVDTPDGLQILRAQGDAGPWIHSRRAPKREVERLLEEVSVKPAQAIVILGIGSGAVVMEVLRRWREHRVIILEPDLALTRTFLEHHDVSREIRALRIFVAVGIKGSPITDQLSDVGEPILRHGFVMVEHPYAKQVEHYALAMRDLADWVEKESASKRSNIYGIRDGLTNLLQNVPNYATASGVIELVDCLPGIPAVMVGAGPSLARNIDVLREFQDRVFILAVSTALKRVLAAGIRVDATAVVDWSHLSQRYFEGINDETMPIFAQPRAHPSTLAAWRGPIIMNDDETMRLLFRDDLPSKGVFEGEANNVAHFAFNNLAGLGVSKIILMGTDLGYSFHVTHAPGTSGQDDLLGSAHRFMNLDTQEMLYVGFAAQAHIRKDVYGNPIAADTQMDHAARTFEDLIHRSTGIEVINATEGGQVLKGARNQTLRETLCDQPPVLEALAGFRAKLKRENQRESLVAALGTLERATKYNESLDRSYHDAIRVMRGAVNRVKRGKIPLEAEIAIEKISAKVKEWYGAYACASAFCPADLHIRNQRKEAVEESDMPELQRLRELAEIELDFLAGIVESLDIWRGILKGGLEATRARLEAAP